MGYGLEEAEGAFEADWVLLALGFGYMASRS